MLNNFLGRFFRKAETIFGARVKNGLFIKKKRCIVLAKGNDLITDEKSLAETFNNYFVNVVSNLGVNILDDNPGKCDVSNYDNHPSIITIKQHITDKNI